MATKSYNSNNGRYQERAEFYYKQLPKDGSSVSNPYLDIYRCIVNVYASCHHFGIRFFDKGDANHWEPSLAIIRETDGLSRCWGHANEVLELISRWRGYIADIHLHTNAQAIDEEVIAVEAGASTELLLEALESLMDAFLEILPAYVSWVPTAKLPENQLVVNFLQTRGDEYRAIGNPKFYAYDRVVTTLANATIPVSATNCKYFKGVGPHISQHIIEFFSGNAAPHVTPEERAALTDNQVQCLYHDTEELQMESEDDEPQTESKDEEPQTESKDEEKDRTEPTDTELQPHWTDRECPMLNRDENGPLAEYLWNTSLEFYAQRYRGHAWAWRRAAETVYSTEHRVEDHLDTLDSETAWEHFPYIGVKMADVIREFYQNVDQGGATEEQELPAECPQSTAVGDAEEYQQGLLNHLWDNGYMELAVEIAANEALPQTRSDFKSFDNCNPQLLEFMFTRSDNLPVATNWRNNALIEWLWSCGCECPGPTAASYYNAARAVARKVNAVFVEDLEAVKYIGPHIAERARGELAGLIDPQQYRDMRKELNRLRSLEL
jgi:hypothetical protein